MVYDIIVVGTGFSSTFFLHKLLDLTKGKKILVLERGTYETHFNQLEDRKKSGKSRIQKKGKTTFVNTGKKPWVYTPAFGGSSNCWWGCTPRMLPNDFRLYSRYGVGADWPISYNELEKYYCEAEKIMGISGDQNPDNLPYPMSRHYPLPPHRLNSVDMHIRQKYTKYYTAQPTARPSVTVDSRPRCCASNVCHLCPIDSKFTVLNSMEHLYKSKNITLEYNAQAYKLIREGSHIKGVHYKKNNKEATAYAKTVVLGANALFNPHILLNSGDEQEWTGKGLCEQVSVNAEVFYTNIKNFDGSTSITGQGFMFYDGMHRKDHAACIIEHQNIPKIRFEVGKLLNLSVFKFIYEDIPQKQNRVTLSEDILMPKVIYKGHSEYADKALTETSNKLKDMLKGIEVDKYSVNKYINRTEAHILSTTRMSLKSEDGVVDKHLVHHRYKNLIILGGSVFPTASPSNPTLTMAALSLYAAEKYLWG